MNQYWYEEDDYDDPEDPSVIEHQEKHISYIKEMCKNHVWNNTEFFELVKNPSTMWDLLTYMEPGDNLFDFLIKKTEDIMSVVCVILDEKEYSRFKSALRSKQILH